MKKLLVHLHLYYTEQLDFMINRLKSIHECNWDLYVTILNEDNSVREKLLKFKKDTCIIKVENRGFDILPFLQILRQVNINEYDYILKIHTKRHINIKGYLNGININGYFWRDSLISSLLSNKDTFKQNLETFKNNDIGIIVNKDFLFKFNSYTKYPLPEENHLLEKLKKRINIQSSFDYFIAGSMFMARAAIFKNLIKSDISPSDFEEESESGGNSTIAHTIERIFCILAIQHGYKVFARSRQPINDNL